MKLFQQTVPTPAGGLDVVNRDYVTDLTNSPIGGMELVDKITVETNTGSVTFSAAGHGERRHDVNSSVDQRYILVLRINNATGGTAGYFVRPNNTSGSQQTESSAVSAGVNTALVTGSIHLISTASTSIFARSDIQVMSGFERLFHNWTAGSVGGDALQRVGSSVWNNRTSDITSLVVASDVSTGIGSGSILELWRVKSSYPINAMPTIGAEEFMDRIVLLTASATSLKFGAGGNGIYNRVIDGDDDEEYICRFRTVGSGSYTLRPNGYATGARMTLLYGNGTTAFSTEFTNLVINGTAPVGTEETKGTFTFDGRTGLGTRRFVTDFDYIDSTPTPDIPFHEHNGGFWLDSTSSLSYLELFATTGSFGIGSYFDLFRRTSRSVRADSAATYERQVTAGIDSGSFTTEEYTTGRIVYPGSLIGMTTELLNPIVSGSIVVNVKVDGSTKLSVTMNQTSNQSYGRSSAGVGTHRVSALSSVTVEVVPSGTMFSGGAADSGLTVNAMFVNESIYQPLLVTSSFITGIQTTTYTASMGETVRTSGSWDMLLPGITGLGSVWVKRVTEETTPMTYVASGSQTIDDVAEFVNSDPRQSFEFRSDGTGSWMIF